MICLIAAGASVAPSYLLFGCRGEQADFYYKRLWQQLLVEGILSPEGGLLTAFSRDQKQKVYVQDKLHQHGGLLWDVLHKVWLTVTGIHVELPVASCTKCLKRCIETSTNVSRTVGTPGGHVQL